MLQDVLPRDRNKFNKPVFKIGIFETFLKMLFSTSSAQRASRGCFNRVLTAVLSSCPKESQYVPTLLPTAGALAGSFWVDAEPPRWVLVL